jgi:hypothetical protein
MHIYLRLLGNKDVDNWNMNAYFCKDMPLLTFMSEKKKESAELRA